MYFTVSLHISWRIVTTDVLFITTDHYWKINIRVKKMKPPQNNMFPIPFLRFMASKLKINTNIVLLKRRKQRLNKHTCEYEIETSYYKTCFVGYSETITVEIFKWSKIE